jgi:hypothetical protein
MSPVDRVEELISETLLSENVKSVEKVIRTTSDKACGVVLYRKKRKSFVLRVEYPIVFSPGFYKRVYEGSLDMFNELLDEYSKKGFKDYVRVE